MPPKHWDTENDFTWYDDMDEMQKDDEYLQRIYADLRTKLTPENQKLTTDVHVYPSKKCTYTLDKARIFVRTREFLSREKEKESPVIVA